MDDNHDDAARNRAYEIWEENGRPEGEHESHWYQALKELGLVNPAEQPLGSVLSPTAPQPIPDQPRTPTDLTDRTDDDLPKTPLR